MKNLIYKVGILSSLLLMLLSSCGKDEFNNISAIENDLIDTVVIQSTVEVREGNDLISFNGAYANCIDVGITQSKELHVLAYGSDLRIEDGEGIYEEPIYVLFWSTVNEGLRIGDYLVEGVYIANNGSDEEGLCFNLSITEINQFAISGNFSTVAGSTVERSGTFTTSIYTCEELGIEDSSDILETEFTDGRITSAKSNTPTATQLSITIICADVFPDESGLVRMILGGGKIIVDSDLEPDFDENPEFMILLNNSDEYELGKELKASYLGDLTDFWQLTDLPNYLDLLAEGNEITVVISSDTNGYFIGDFYGILSDGTEIEGKFRSQITAC